MNPEINSGVYPTMLTPFTADNKIDYDGVTDILNYYAASGVDGIFAICQSSEIFYLSFEEKLALLRFIKANLPGGMSLVASGHTADDLKTQIEEAKAFINEGIDAYVFIANRFSEEGESDDVFLSNYEKATRALDGIPFGIYECPYPYKKIMTPSLLRECMQISPLSFIKDTCCSLEMIKEKLEAANGTPLKIFNANGATLFESLRAGCAGYSGVMANFHPDLYVHLCRNYMTDSEDIRLLASFLSFASTIELQQYPVNAKYHMQCLGLNVNMFSRVRDCATFTGANKMEIRAMIETENHIRATLGL
ncbi:MAG: dihydrodipicolinate synthase family protein [Clostridia bacterium]|nr:dihydrodipicolinate synthase family protein [Clostridia bacterium]